MEFFKEVATYQPKNTMNTHNLSVCVSPVVFRPAIEVIGHDTFQSTTYYNIFKQMIDDFDVLFDENAIETLREQIKQNGAEKNRLDNKEEEKKPEIRVDFANPQNNDLLYGAASTATGSRSSVGQKYIEEEKKS